MLIREDGSDGTWLAIGQASHAWACGQMARAWGNDRFPGPLPFEEVALAAEQHDVGMAEWDLRPTLAGDGRPTPFNRLPRHLHLELWSAAARKLESQSRYAALLVSLHGTTLYTALPYPDEDRPAIEAFLDGQRRYQEALRARLGPVADGADANRRLLFCWDALSLALCLGWPLLDLPAVADAAGDDVRIQCRAVAGGATLEPWPFAARSVVVCAEGRRLRGTYADEASLGAALADAPSAPLRWSLTPAAGRA